FAAKDRKILNVEIEQLGEIEEGRHVFAEVTVEVEGAEHRYFLPLSALWGEENLTFGAPKLSYTIAKLRHGPRVGALIDGVLDEGLAKGLLGCMRNGATIGSPTGDIVFTGNSRLAEFAEVGEPRAIGVEQSNLSLAFGDSLIIKVYRRLRPGIQPEV